MMTSVRFAASKAHLIAILATIFAILVPISGTAQVRTEMPEIEIESCQNLLMKNLVGNRFVIGRGGFRYRRFLGPHYVEALQGLTPSSTWVDLGAGEARAMLAFAGRKSPEKLPKMIAVGFEKPRSSDLDSQLIRLGSKFEYRSGKLFEDMEFGDQRADLITDVIGPVSYSYDLAAVLGKGLRLLRQGGRFVFILLEYDNSSMRAAMMRPDNRNGVPDPVRMLEIRNREGAKISVREYLEKIRGARLVSLKSTSPFILDDSVLQVVLERTDDEVVVPHLKVLDYDGGKPPKRVYQEIEQGL